LGPLVKLIATLYFYVLTFRNCPAGAIARLAGFGILRFLWFLREEILLVLATSSSEPALPALMTKLERLGCSKALVGLVVPTGYTFNADGTSLIDASRLFVAQADQHPLTLLQQFTILGVALLTSKGRKRCSGSCLYSARRHHDGYSHHTGSGNGADSRIDRFLSMCRAVVNMIGNAVATLVVARWEK